MAFNSINTPLFFEEGSPLNFAPAGGSSLRKNDIFDIDVTLSLSLDSIFGKPEEKPTPLNPKRIALIIDKPSHPVPLDLEDEGPNPIPQPDLEEEKHFPSDDLEPEERIYAKHLSKEDQEKITEFLELEKEFVSFSQKFHMLRRNSPYQDTLDYCAKPIEYANVNRSTLSTIIDPFIPEGQESTESGNKKGWHNGAEEIHKTVIPLGYVICHTTKIVNACQGENVLLSIQERFAVLRPQILALNQVEGAPSIKEINSLNKKIHGLYAKLVEDKASNVDKCLAKGVKLAGRAIQYPLEQYVNKDDAGKWCKNGVSIIKNAYSAWKIGKACRYQKEWVHHLSPRILIDHQASEASQEQLNDETISFLNSLSLCKNVEEVKKIFKQRRMSIEEDVPNDFASWQQLFEGKRFRRYIIQSYYHSVGKKPVFNTDDVKSLLRKREKDFKATVDANLTKIFGFITTTHEFTFEEIKDFFAKQHIYLNCLEFPPQNKEEWELRINDLEFQRSLAKQWVEYQETSAKLLDQGLRQSLLSKNAIESKFLNYRWKENIASITLSLIQFALTFRGMHFSSIAAISEAFSIDLSKAGIPGIGLIYLLFPDTSLKIETLIASVSEYLFLGQYKPHTYSKESYKLFFQKRWLLFISKLHSQISLFKQFMLWINIRLVENCIMGLPKKPLEEYSKYTEIQEDEKQFQLKCRKRLKELKILLRQMRLLDEKKIIQPSYGRTGPNGEKVDSIEIIANTLEELDMEMFSERTREFIETNFGIKLTENRKDLKKEFEKFFLKNEMNFVNSNRKNRFIYTRE